MWASLFRLFFFNENHVPKIYTREWENRWKIFFEIKNKEEDRTRFKEFSRFFLWIYRCVNEQFFGWLNFRWFLTSLIPDKSCIQLARNPFFSLPSHLHWNDSNEKIKLQKLFVGFFLQEIIRKFVYVCTREGHKSACQFIVGRKTSFIYTHD